MKPIDMGMLVRVAQAVNDSLRGATVIAMLPSPNDTIEHNGYWERAFIVVWQRAIPEGMSRIGTDGFVYATHRVHVNSDGDSACFTGHYDLTYETAIQDMLSRAKISVVDEKPETYIQLVIDEDGFKSEQSDAFTDADLVSFGKEANDIASHWLGYSGWRAKRNGRFVFAPEETQTGS